MGRTMLAVCLLTLSVVKSDSSGANDLGFRGMLVVQFVLLIWSATVVHDVFLRKEAAARAGFGAPWIKPALIFTLVLGLAGTAFQLAALRCYAPLADAGKVERTERVLGSPGFGERTYWLRRGFRRLAAAGHGARGPGPRAARDELTGSPTPLRIISAGCGHTGA